MNPVDPSSNVVRKLRLRAFMFLAAALVLGTGAVVLVKAYLDRARAVARASASATTGVVVAAADLPIATVLEEKHLRLIAWPTKAVPKDAILSLKAAVGHSLGQSLVENELILPDRMVDPSRGRGLSALLAPGTRAMAVKVDQVIGVAGFVGPGDYVDVIVTLKPDDETLESLGAERIPKISKIVLQNIKVLAAGEQLQTDGRKPVKVQVVTLEVTPDQSERLALSSQYGKIQLTMRSRLDQVAAETSGVTPSALLSPDEMARLLAMKPEAKPAEPTKRAEPSSSSSSRRRRKPETAVVAKPAEPDGPIVEILRAGKREERKLLPSADSKPNP